MRLFIAVDLPDAVKTQAEQLHADIPGAAWVRRQALHLTLQFLGDGISDARLPEIKAALETVRAYRFDMALKGVGCFPPNPRQPPRVVWVGVVPSPALNELYQQVMAAMHGVGFAPDERGFSPHITLARLKQPYAAPQVEHFIARFGDFETDPFPVNEVILFSSLLTPQGSHYTRQAALALE